MFPLVSKKAEAVQPESFEVTPFKPPRRGSSFDFELNVVAKPLNGMQKIAEVEPNAPSWSNFVIHCDEGKAMGGSDEAPSPLSYFTSGVAFCLLTHLQEFIHHQQIAIESLKVELKMHFSTMLAVEPVTQSQEGLSNGIEVSIIIESQEDPEVIQALTKLTEQSCIALQSIIRAVPGSIKCIHNGVTH
ncbi:OsmC family protein [Pseudovibrio brasiliensis]|uniref:OsmC family protein n=1 Tax=Pseudovibrio brasiliensis TaxID=1898042 RepID=A0ABX8AXU2_9HYPH|nr:OsmC family protein [Pseudovibrio brasiliensis]QUS59012.1 OsmC family protein [Pseudovibrio brasiliensis]